MNTVNDISERFMEAYNHLINCGQTSDKKDFAVKIGISPSMVTEISKGRSNVGVSAIQNIVLQFYISPDWLITGNGPMLKIESQPDALPLASEPEVQYSKQNDEIQFLKNIIGNQQKIIENQQKELDNKQKVIDKQLNTIEAYEKGKVANISRDADVHAPKRGAG
ncbi:MAG: helix-turn-helix domain-containing protein [Prevotella sp.]|jgi:transcriptional regulator with XRE-family HTH domain|nr:helix-turn-helix domain-containing protein [Prevotella sp.]